MIIAELKQLQESEDKVEFKAARNNFPFAGGSHSDQSERRKCFLGYVVALANEKGGMLVLGMEDALPHNVVGTNFANGLVGNMEDEVFARLGIRVHIEELYEGSNRVLVTHVPSRPIGRLLKFEGVALMRTGESLRNMSDDEMYAILSEQEPDFSATICEGLSVTDLDAQAIRIMKESYARKQGNRSFIQLSNEQALIDLDLMRDGRLTYAALILLGSQASIHTYLPQSKTIWEFRNTEPQIHHDRREVIDEALFISIDKIWSLINQPTLNNKIPVQSGAYIFDIYDFNEEVIREAILNAVAHRDYTMNSEVVIKQSPNKIVINNPGGFPKGVNVGNLLTVNSTPRSRLITDVLEKTGLVERSGQGVDKIYSISLSEGKAIPDYSQSNLFQVSLVLQGEIIDQSFHVFINQYQISDREPKLGVEQIITLSKIRDGKFQDLNPTIIGQLEALALIDRVAGNTNRYTLGEDYQRLVSESLKIGKRYLVKDLELLIPKLQGKSLKVGDLETILSDSLNRSQIKFLLGKLLEDAVLITEGKGRGTKYIINSPFSAHSGHDLIREISSYLRDVYE